MPSTDQAGSADYAAPRPKAKPKTSRVKPPKATPPPEDGPAGDSPGFDTGFGGRPRTADAPKRKRAAGSAKLETKLDELFSALSLPFLLAGDKHCADIIAQGAPRMATAWVDLAEENPGVKRVLAKLTEGSAWGAVILSTASVAVPIAAHHGAPMGPLSGIFGGGQSSPAAGASGARPSSPSAHDGSTMGAPTPNPDPYPSGMAADGYVPIAPNGSPPGIVTVSGRNGAAAA